LRELFSIPILTHQWPDSDELNAELRRVVLGRRDSSPGVVKTNRGGWQSNTDLPSWPDACIRTLMARIQAMMREMVQRTVAHPTPAHMASWDVIAWANANQRGNFNRAHDHLGARSLWSGIYYVDVGQLSPHATVTGRTIFEDRSLVPKEIVNNPDLYEREVRILPENGLMVIFPASLYHSVEPYSGEDVRITIAFNLWNPAFGVPLYPGMERLGWWWTNFRGLMLISAKAPEKLRALGAVPHYLFARRPPASLRPAEWSHYLRTAFDHAFANASERTEVELARRRGTHGARAVDRLGPRS